MIEPINTSLELSQTKDQHEDAFLWEVLEQAHFLSFVLKQFDADLTKAKKLIVQYRLLAVQQQLQLRENQEKLEDIRERKNKYKEMAEEAKNNAPVEAPTLECTQKIMETMNDEQKELVMILQSQLKRDQKMRLRQEEINEKEISDMMEE